MLQYLAKPRAGDGLRNRSEGRFTRNLTRRATPHSLGGTALRVYRPIRTERHGGVFGRKSADVVCGAAGPSAGCCRRSFPLHVMTRQQSSPTNYHITGYVLKLARCVADCVHALDPCSTSACMRGRLNFCSVALKPVSWRQRA